MLHTKEAYNYSNRTSDCPEQPAGGMGGGSGGGWGGPAGGPGGPGGAGGSECYKYVTCLYIESRNIND
jgi:hypothetical protein